MDPKKLNHLDPKLKEVYERVMGTTVAAPSAQAHPVPAPPAKPSESTSTAPAHPAAMPPITNPTMATPPMIKKNGLSPMILIGILVVVFFAIYTVVWMWFFKLPLPFNFS